MTQHHADTTLVTDVHVSPCSFDAMRVSIRSLIQTLSKAFRESVEFRLSRPEIADALDDFHGLVTMHTATCGAGVAEMNVLPSEKYIELLSALAADGFVDIACGSHGWPVLSSVCGNTTIVGRGEAASLSPEEGNQ